MFDNNNQSAQKQPQQNTQVQQRPALVNDKTIDLVLDRINTFKATGDIKFPPDYSPENAVRAAWIIIKETKDRSGNLAINSCTKESICDAMLKMVVWGLSPLKKQCDFIVYGNKLSCDPEYTGNIALAKRYGGLKSIKANVILEGDDFQFEINETGRRKLVKHIQNLDSLGDMKIKGAYAVYELNDGTMDMEVMNMRQIQAAWNQGATKGSSPAHKNFPDQMSIKTVINRACKLLIRSSDDSVLYSDETDDLKDDAVMASTKQTIRENANKQEISMNDEPIQEAEEVKDDPKQQTSTEENPI